MPGIGCYIAIPGILVLQRLTDILDNIIHILNSDTQTDQAWINACLPELLIGELTVSMACRMQNAGSRIGNMGYDGCQFQLIHELASCLTTAL